MMDLYCPVCGEPTDNDYFHDVADEQNTTYADVTARFRLRGCEALGESHSETKGDPAIWAIYDVMGDDMDGAASFFEDIGL